MFTTQLNCAVRQHFFSYKKFSGVNKLLTKRLKIIFQIIFHCAVMLRSYICIFALSKTGQEKVTSIWKYLFNYRFCNIEAVAQLVEQ